MGPRKQTRKGTVSWRDTWTAEQREYLEIFETAKVVPTIWACQETMRYMGIEQDVDTLLNNMGLGDLHLWDFPSYIEPTIHFFSSLELQRDYKTEVPNLAVNFRIRGEAYSMTIREVSEALNLDLGTTTGYLPLRIPHDFWDEIAQGPWDSANAKNSHIRNPALRYTVRLLANTFFARRDPRKVKANELSLIYRAVREQLGLEEVCYREPDNSCVFLANLIRGRKRLLKTKGNILNFGGMLTPLFMYLGIDLDGFARVEERRVMDLDYVRASKFCPNFEWEGRGYIHDFMIRGRRVSCRLPLPNVVDVTTADGVRFIPPRAVYFDSLDDPAEKKRKLTRANTPYHGRYLEDESNDEAEEEEVVFEEPEEQPEIPPLSPRASTTHKKWYRLHKFNGKAIKDMFHKWSSTSKAVDELRSDVTRLQADMRDMHIRQAPQVHAPQAVLAQAQPRPEPTYQGPRASADGTFRSYIRRPRQPQRHSVDGARPPTTRTQREGKAPLVQEEPSTTPDDDEIDPNVL